MKKVLKKGAKASLRLVKKAVNKNKHTKRLAQKAKRVALLAIGTNDQRELYNLTTFYPTIQDYYRQQQDAAVGQGPLISILLPTYNTPETYLRDCIESIIVQSYPNWELCIADDSSTDPQVVKIIKGYQDRDDRIKLVQREVNGHISEATNSALEIANGEFVALMDHDDVLWPSALYEMVRTIQANKDVDFIYSDEDKIDGSGKLHSYPFLKPDFSPEFLESCNYITHFSCIRTVVMREVGGFRKDYEGAQDWDLFMRISEQTQRIIHLPKILYSWRIHAASTASDTDAKPYVYEAQKKLLVDHLTRTGRAGTVETGIITQHRTIKYQVTDNPKVTMVILYDSLEGCKRLLDSTMVHPAGLGYSALFVCREEAAAATKAALNERYPTLTKTYFQLEKMDTKSQYQDIAAQSGADYFIFADSTVEIVSDNWAKSLVADCQLSGVGVVGPVLLDETTKHIRSAGLGIGYGPAGCTDMLADMPFDDPHYTRGLYAKSRRNVSAVNSALFAISKSSVLSVQASSSLVDLCLKLLQKGKRHVYNPYVQVVLHTQPSDPKVAPGLLAEDPYLNPNFDHSNSRMEVRA